MTDMIEKMARAMCDAQGEVWEYTPEEPNKNTPLYSDSLRAMYLAHAKAALSALEEPSEAMVEAGNMSLTWGIVPDDELRAAFSAMIKAAKEEE